MAARSINPFTGTDLEEPWQQGFATAVLVPDGDHTPPSPLTAEAQDAFRQGIAAGEIATGQLTVPPIGFEEDGDWQKMLEIGGHAILDRAGFFAELIEANEAGALTLGAITRIALGGSLSFLLFLVFSGTLTGDGDFIELAAGSALRRVRAKLAAGESAENRDLFMAVCDEPRHGLPATDEILKNGFWHGKVFLQFDQAAGEGRRHEHPSSVRVVHCQTATPGLVEVLDI